MREKAGSGTLLNYLLIGFSLFFFLGKGLMCEKLKTNMPHQPVSFPCAIWLCTVKK